MDCPEVMGPYCLISEEEVSVAIKLQKCSEMMKVSGGFGTRWMNDLINNIAKEGCIPNDWRNCILMPVYKGKGDPIVCGSYRAIKVYVKNMENRFFTFF